jgi:hypothetical protein
LDSVITKLHGEVDVVLTRLAADRAVGLPYETYLHRARLQNLLDTAGHHGVDLDTCDSSRGPTPPGQVAIPVHVAWP